MTVCDRIPIRVNSTPHQRRRGFNSTVIDSNFREGLHDTSQAAKVAVLFLMLEGAMCKPDVPDDTDNLSEQVTAVRLHLAPELCGIAEAEIPVGLLRAVLSGSYHHRHGQGVTEQQRLLL